MASKQQTEIGDGFLASALKVLIVSASVGVASVAGFYVHPHLLPLLTQSVPELWAAAHGWLTAPILFLLVNLVVGTIYFSSGFVQKADKQKVTSQRSHAKESGAGDHGSSNTAVRSEFHDPPAARPISGIRARIEEKSRPFRRLVRSKSEQIVPRTAKKSEEVGASGRLKKAGTFESAAQGSERRKEVVVADPAVEEVATAAAHTTQEQEVDQKAEDFISRFYHRVKLQRLDSLLRKQQQQAG